MYERSAETRGIKLTRRCLAYRFCENVAAILAPVRRQLKFLALLDGSATTLRAAVHLFLARFRTNFGYTSKSDQTLPSAQNEAIVYFEGGEPFLFYPLLLEGLRMVRAAGLQAGIVTNGFWATSVEDGMHWLRPIRDLGLADFSVSDDEFHRINKDDRRAEFACEAAQHLGIPTSRICIEPPSASHQSAEGRRGSPVIGGGVLFKGRAAEKLTAGLPVRPLEELATCPHEELFSPERLHVDAYGNVHLCQGLSLGNIWETPLPDLLRRYDAEGHPIAGPLLRGGPIRLAREHGLRMNDCYVDECHLCYAARKLLLPRFPRYLAPREAYGLSRRWLFFAPDSRYSLLSYSQRSGATWSLLSTAAWSDGQERLSIS